MEVGLIVKDTASDEERAGIIGGLVGYNDAAAWPEEYRELVVLAHVGGRLAGGLLGFTHWNWLFLKQLWLAAEFRGGGLGQRVVVTAEEEAVARGCAHVHCDTFGFQALGFYQRLGYKIFGQLEDYPPGHTRYYLQKRNLAGTAACPQQNA